jgi:hypothetical protein
MRAGVVAAQGDNDVTGAIDNDRGHGVTVGFAAVDGRFCDRLGGGIGKVAVSDELCVSQRDDSANGGADHNKTRQLY